MPWSYACTDQKSITNYKRLLDKTTIHFNLIKLSRYLAMQEAYYALPNVWSVFGQLKINVA
jgi:hypothetical protein